MKQPAFRILGLCFFLLASSPEMPAQNSPSDDAAPIGTARRVVLFVGEGYVTEVESVGATITALEVVRGEKAWELVKAASPSNRPAENGFEYAAARIRFQLEADGAAGNRSYGIREEQFASVSSSGNQYATPAIVQPRPALNGRLYSGDSLEGWVAFLVAVEDKKPLMSFGNNYRRYWFRLH
jgi:hypothetical protein